MNENTRTLHADSITAFPRYDLYATETLLHAYSTGAARLNVVIEGLTEDDLRARARGPATWSVHEIVLHVTDSELQGAFRIRKVWSQPGADLPGYDQDAWARELAYQRSNEETRMQALQLFAMLRKVSVSLFTRARGTDWDRSGKHPEYGSLTLRNFLELYADHSERHIAQILEIRKKLGKPLPLFSPLLPQRLY